jgi:homoserine acetyltransferase
MSNINRLRQYLTKACFSSESDKNSALECLAELEQANNVMMEALKKIKRPCGHHTFVSDLQHIAHTAIIKATCK